MDKYFKQPSDLNHTPNVKDNSNNDYFTVAGDLNEAPNLSEPIKKEESSNTLPTNNYFTVAEDLSDSPSTSEPLNTDDVATTFTANNVSVGFIVDYLSSVVSGKEYDFECELGTLCGGGSSMVSFTELQNMVNDGSYNIIKAQCINPEMIIIEYQRFNKDQTRGSR